MFEGTIIVPLKIFGGPKVGIHVMLISFQLNRFTIAE
jgi:hypothetical protein